jgi:hypothetical protein
MAFGIPGWDTHNHDSSLDFSKAEKKMPVTPFQYGSRPQDKEPIRRPAGSVIPLGEDGDREMDLKHITIVWAPIWNTVFRSRGCMCRLGGDSSPFAKDIDITFETPCRLHFPRQIAVELGVDLKCPQEGYDPDQDPYFDRFGGRMAFAAFIATNPIIKRSIDVRTLLPTGMWFEASDRLRAAGQIEHQREALLDWQKEYQEWYFDWRSKHKTEQMKRKKQLKSSRRTGQHEAPERLKLRRGSFS